MKIIIPGQTQPQQEENKQPTETNSTPTSVPIVVSTTEPSTSSSKQETTQTQQQQRRKHSSRKSKSHPKQPHSTSTTATTGINPPAAVRIRGNSSSSTTTTTTPSNGIIEAAAAPTQHQQQNLDEGYNSGDEYRNFVGSLLPKGMSDSEFEAILFKSRGFEIRHMIPDGNCLFRSIADQVYGDQELHSMVREQCFNYMEKERIHFSQYITEDFTQYLQRKRKLKSHGNHIELQAMAELFNRPIEVFAYSINPINTFQSENSSILSNPTPNSTTTTTTTTNLRQQGEYVPLRVSYHHGNHFNSVIDPLNPSVGVGLGIANYKPQPIDKIVTTKVREESEVEQVDSLFVSKAMSESDVSETQHDVEQAIIESSRLEFLKSLASSIIVPQSSSNGKAPNPK